MRTQKTSTQLVPAAAVLAALAIGSDARAQVFNWFDPIIDYSQNGTGNWVPVDVSADVPAGATGVMLHVKTETGTDYKWAVRKNGSSDEWMWGPDTIKNDTHTWFIVGVDSNRVFEVKQESNTTEIWLLGYTTDGVTLFDDAIDMNVGAGTWEDVDISPYTGGDSAIAGIFVIQNTNNSQGWSIRMNGAADNRGSHCPGGSAGGDLRTNMSTLAIVGVDGGELCEVCIESTEIKAYLVGYVTEGAVFFQEPIQKTVALSYVDNDISGDIGGDDANGAFVQIWTDFDDRHQTAIRKNGATYDFDKWTSNQFAPVAVDDSYIFEFETDDTDGIEIWLYGYALDDITNYRSIGTNAATLYSAGTATISQGSRVITFSGTLPSNVGVGDEITIGGDTFWVKTRNSSSQVTVHTASPSNHTNAGFTITRAYNDIQVWENDRNGNLVGDNRNEVGVCYNDGEFAAGDIVIDGSTTDPTHHMTLTVAEGQRHDGIAGAGVRINGASASNEVFDPSDEYTVIEWLEIRNFDGLFTDAFDIDTDNVTVQNLLIHDYVDASHAIGGDGDYTVRNCILYDGDEGIRAEGGTVVIENCTIYNMDSEGIQGRSGATGIEVRNCIVLDNNTDMVIDCTVDYFGYNMYETTSGFNPSSYAGNNQSPPADRDDLWVSITPGSEDLHLEASGHNALDTGLDLSSSFTTDIDGNTRIAPWDMGADEQGGGPAPGLAVNYRSIGTDAGTLYSTGNASISAGSTTMTFAGGASLPGNVGPGDEISIGADSYYIESTDSTTQVTVDTASTSTHTSSVYSVTRAYNDIQAWENDRDGDLAGEDRREVGVCYDDGPFSTATVINGSTTDDTHYMTLTVAQGQRHTGTGGTGARIDAGGGFGTSVIDVLDQYTRVEWLEITNWKDSKAGVHFDDSPASDNSDGSSASNLLLHDFGLNDGSAGLVVRSDGIVIRNCMIYDGVDDGIFQSAGSLTVESCTMHKVSDGIKQYAGSSLTVRNTIAVDSADDDFDLEGTVAYFNYNMYGTTEDFTPSGGNDQSPPGNLDDLFVSISSGSENLHLEPTGHNAIDTGVDIAGYANDIDDDPRLAGSWDIGADESGGFTNYRSIGTYAGTIYSNGNASIASGSRTATFGGGASLPANVGQGDELVIGAETFYIMSRDTATEVTTQSAAASGHTGAAYTIARAYNTIASWESDRDGDLVGEKRGEVGVCYNDGTFTPAGDVIFDDSTTDATYYMMLTVADGQRHNGTAGSGVRVDGVNTTGEVFNINDAYTVVEWLEVYNFDTNGADAFDIDTGPATLSNLIIYDFAGRKAVNLNAAATVRNTIIYGGAQGIWASGDLTAENVTIYGMTTLGIDGANGVSYSVTNCIAVDCPLDIDISGTVVAFDHNMYSVLTGTSAGSNDQAPPADLDDLFYSITPGSEDLHLEDSGHNARDTGQDLSSTFTTDIDGGTRTAPWDMGADEITGSPLQITSAASQTFTENDPVTAIEAITVTDHGETPVITAADDIRIRIPAGFNMTWDYFDNTATISGPASGKVSPTVSYEDSDMTLVVNVTSDFAASDSVTIADLGFRSFSGASAASNLGLDVNDDATADATDDKTIEIDAAGAPPPTTSALLSWSEVPNLDAVPDPTSEIRFDNMTVSMDTVDRPSASFSHEVGSSCTCCTDPVLIVIVVSRCDHGVQTNGVTYGAQMMDLEVSEEAEPATSGREWVQIYSLANPPLGTNTLDVTFNTNDNPSAIVALSYFGVNQSDPVGATASDSNPSSSNPVTVDITTTVPNSLVVGGLGQHGGDTYPHDHQGDVTMERFDDRSGTATGGDSGYAVGEINTPTVGTYTFEWDGALNDDWAIGCVELKPAN